MELNPADDVQINVAKLDEEFRILPALIYRYSEMRAESGYEADIAEAEYKEIRAEVYKNILTTNDKKPSEKTIESEIDINPLVKAAKRKALQTKRDHETIKGYLDSLRAKKDMLIQIGSDRRKEV